MQASRALPNHLVIGAAKSGTTSLYELLRQHPQVYLPYAKEPRYFNNDANYARGSRWYQQTYFRKAAGFPVRAEASPHYLYWGEKVAARIQATCTDGAVRFITILRDPVKRAYSQYWMDFQRGVENLPFPEALDAEAERLETLRPQLEPAGLLKFGYFRGGCYASLLEPFLQRFPRQHFHFLLLEDLQADLDHTMDALCAFLGIPPGFEFQPVVSNTSYNPHSRSLQHWLLQRPDGFYRILRALVRVIPEARRYQLRKRVLESNRQPQPNPVMDPAVETRLRAAYQPEITRLEAILGRDLSQWKKQAA